MQHAMPMRHIVSGGLSGSTLFSTLSHKWHDFRKKLLIYNVCFYFLYAFVWNISHSKKNERYIIKKIFWPSCKIPVILVRFYWKLNFLDRLSKNTQISNFMKIRCFMWQTGRRTDMAKLIVTFRTFANASKNRWIRAIEGSDRCLFWEPH
jgi:hypothetical protein